MRLRSELEIREGGSRKEGAKPPLLAPPNLGTGPSIFGNLHMQLPATPTASASTSKQGLPSSTQIQQSVQMQQPVVNPTPKSKAIVFGLDPDNFPSSYRIDGADWSAL